MLTLLFDGIAYGMLLFVLAVGLAVTLGLMNFINLAHGAFAMAGGYAAVLLMNRAGWPFLASLPAAFAVAAVAGVVLERTLYRPMYDQRVAAGLGLDVNRIFALTFAVGSGLAGLGGALGAEVLGLDPTFPLKFMIYFLIVVAVGGTTTITGPLLAALLLGVADVMGKYYVPELGAFIVYTVMIVILMLRPQGLFGRSTVR